MILILAQVLMKWRICIWENPHSIQIIILGVAILGPGSLDFRKDLIKSSSPGLNT